MLERYVPGFAKGADKNIWAKQALLSRVCIELNTKSIVPSLLIKLFEAILFFHVVIVVIFDSSVL